MDAALPGLPAISTVETAGELAKTAPQIKKKRQGDYEDWGDTTGEWGKKNPYYDCLGVKTKDKKSYGERIRQ